MQSLNQFSQFELNTKEANNVNGGNRFKISDLRSTSSNSRFRVIGRRFGAVNTTLLDGTNLNALGNVSSYSSYDGSNYEQALEEANTEILTSPVSGDYEPHQIIL